MTAGNSQPSEGSDQTYNFAYLDEQTKRSIRRIILKAIAVPGYQVPFGGREMPLPYGWGTGGIQITASILTKADVLKVIDQGADDTTNAVSIRQFFARVAGVATTEKPRRRPSFRPGTAFPTRRLNPDRSWCSRCRFQSRCDASSRARSKLARCMRSGSMA